MYYPTLPYPTPSCRMAGDWGFLQGLCSVGGPFPMRLNTRNEAALRPGLH